MLADQIAATNDNVLFVAIHADDVMENDNYFSQTGLTALPSGNIDRALTNIDPLDWEVNIQNRQMIPAPADIVVTTNFDETTLDLEIIIEATFTENLIGDFQLAAIIMEDAVTGPAPDYDQSNAYAGGDEGPMGGYEDLPNPVPASLMVYDHVARVLPGDYQGDTDNLPDVIASGSVHTLSLIHI